MPEHMEFVFLCILALIGLVTLVVVVGAYIVSRLMDIDITIHTGSGSGTGAGNHKIEEGEGDR